jgi:hypothetical protein
LPTKSNKMKKILSICAIACVTLSCNNDTKQAEAAQQQRSLDSMKTEMVRQKTIDSMNAAASAASAKVAEPVQSSTETQVSTVSSSHHSTPHHSSSHTTTTNNYYSNGANNSAPVAAPAPVAAAPKKKGWSAKAKGAVIGAGAGAVTGALLDKNKGAGALIGGAIGGAAGLGAGAIIDKKQNR